jgi:T-complex protein 1 subunit gamma
MLKMILSMSGSVLLTADGNSILREIDVSSPAAKSMIELSRAQDEEVGDGTTSVTILSGEILSAAEPWLEKQMHPRTIIMGYTRALTDALEYMKSIAVPVDTNNRDQMLNIVKKCLGTKFVSGYFPPHIAEMSLDAVRTVLVESEGRRDIDIKRFIRVEKVRPTPPHPRLPRLVFMFLVSIRMLKILSFSCTKVDDKWSAHILTEHRDPFFLRFLLFLVFDNS